MSCQWQRLLAKNVLVANMPGWREYLRGWKKKYRRYVKHGGGGRRETKLSKCLGSTGLYWRRELILAHSIGVCLRSTLAYIFKCLVLEYVRQFVVYRFSISLPSDASMLEGRMKGEKDVSATRVRLLGKGLLLWMGEGQRRALMLEDWSGRRENAEERASVWLSVEANLTRMLCGSLLLFSFFHPTHWILSLSLDVIENCLGYWLNARWIDGKDYVHSSMEVSKGEIEQCDWFRPSIWFIRYTSIRVPFRKKYFPISFMELTQWRSDLYFRRTVYST